MEAGYVITVKCSWENLGGKYTGVHREALSICILEIFHNKVFGGKKMQPG